MTRVVTFCETTLRDGEQTPGINYFPEEKLEIARALADMGFDLLECGFPISGEPELRAVQLIARNISSAGVGAIARAYAADIDCAWEGVRDAACGSLHPFISTSPLHRAVKLGKSREQVLEMARAAVAHARQYTSNVDFALEDTTRTEREFVLEVVEAVLGEGARFITLCDTVGVALPPEFGELVDDVLRAFPTARISAHCHNDLGLATANGITALVHGAERVDTCFNGLGERAGNAATEEVVMALYTRGPHLGLQMHIDTTRLTPTSQLVARLSGMQPHWTKAIVGANAFLGDDGDAVDERGLLGGLDYLPVGPQGVGLASTSRNAEDGGVIARDMLDAQLRTLGYDLSQRQLARAYEVAGTLRTGDENGHRRMLEEREVRRCAAAALRAHPYG